MAFNYPAQPWKDGQEIKATVGGKELVIAKYDSSKNLWTHLKYNDDGQFFYTTACKVPVDFEECPCDDLNADSLWENTANVQNALDWLHFQLMRAFERIEALEPRVRKNEIDIEFLYQALSAIENLADVSDFLNRLDEIEEKIDNLTAADITQVGIEVPAGFEIPDSVKQGSQQETNYYLADLIAELDEHTIWFGAAPPDVDEEKYKFWWDTEALELLINYNDQWFPVAIPPRQLEILRQELDQLYTFTSNNRVNIFDLQQEADGKFFDIDERLDQIEASVPDPDEFYPKTGGDLDGYVYSKGNNAGYYLGSQDGDLLANFRELKPQEANLTLRNSTKFKLDGFAPGDNAAFSYINLDTSISNGLKIGRLANPTASYDAANKRYVDEQVAQTNFQHPGMGLKWTYNGSGSATTGKFSFVDDKFLYVNGETADGRKIFNDLNANQHSPHSAPPLITIYRIINNEMYVHMVLNCKETRFGYNSSGRMQFIVDAWLRPHSISTGVTYYITVGGLC